MNSPAVPGGGVAGICGGATGLADAMVEGGAGDWNDRVNSPGGDWGEAGGGGGALGFAVGGVVEDGDAGD